MHRITVDTSNVRSCAGCGARPPTYLYRHHKGHDKLIGKFNKKIRHNYRRYLHCVDLCDNCHMGIHYYMDLTVLSLTSITRRNALWVRRKLIRACDVWLTLSHPQRPLPSSSFVDRWRQSHAEWLASRSKQRQN